MRIKWSMNILGFVAFVLILFIVLIFKYNQDDCQFQINNRRLTKYLQTLENLKLANDKLNAELAILNEKIRIQQSKKELKDIEPITPSKDYEVLRRRIFSNTKEFWYYINSGLESLNKSIKNVERLHEIKNMAGEHYRSLLKDVSGLAEVDNYSTWRQQESESLSNLVQNRFKKIQNPPNLFTARQLVCTFKKNCGFNCQLHHVVYCLIVAYNTQRMLVLDYKNWTYGEAWQDVFLPLSDSNTLLKNVSVVEWPGHQNSQIIHLPPIDLIHPKPYFLPQVIPNDLAERLTVLHGDPIVWWIGQILKYLLRLQESTNYILNYYAKKLKFQKPIVGLHIRRTDKLISETSIHTLDEYMVHVEDYYKRKKLSGKVNQKRIYLATNEPTLFDEAKRNYPEYEIVGSEDISKTATMKNQNFKKVLNGRIVDIHFLSLSDHLVCTFSSQMCRIAYEIMNSLHPDASAQYTSLDDIYYFYGQDHRLNEAVLSHKANKLYKIDLQVGDQIFVDSNHWNGYSKGQNLRTGLVGLYPTYKVISKIETATITDSKNKKDEVRKTS
ncbi:LOW QUALITY PROTEIN: alpha-(1,6)-fucosyltransferase-like [Melanaphis sacchari]|uniref:LOW QUALITY PROTEIN: alpha-(1,6)-fucosyltransferase-like n=1 Tax=Melanaphis sacchari TaxID=742174 RepID=UPI000DC1460A|nr:LOW QUALITY PROTEIN: alpha-(1,6)-fucosyltransferase-like [Melanaphis sacchari]